MSGSKKIAIIINNPTFLVSHRLDLIKKINKDYQLLVFFGHYQKLLDEHSIKILKKHRLNFKKLFFKSSILISAPTTAETSAI